eukprot:362548-Chlamydomonas_euryale.AAC.3
MVKQPAGRGHKQVDALDKALSLGAPVGAAHHEAVRLCVVAHKVAHDAVDLHRQLTGRADHDRASAVALQELGSVQQLHTWDEEGKRLARACAGAADNC